jgi:hypothetical protein
MKPVLSVVLWRCIAARARTAPVCLAVLADRMRRGLRLMM